MPNLYKTYSKKLKSNYKINKITKINIDLPSSPKIKTQNLSAHEKSIENLFITSNIYTRVFYNNYEKIAATTILLTR